MAISQVKSVWEVGELVFTNTLYDVVRFASDHVVKLSDDLQAQAFIGLAASQMLRENNPNGEARRKILKSKSPGMARALTVSHLQEVTHTVLGTAEMDLLVARPAVMFEKIASKRKAQECLQQTFSRHQQPLSSDRSPVDTAYKRRLVSEVERRTNAICHDWQTDVSALRSKIFGYEDNVWSEQAARSALLSDTIYDTANRAVAQMFAIAHRGDVTAGRMATAFGILLQPTCMRHHELVTDPGQQVVRELKMFTGVLSDELQQGVLQNAALASYTDRLKRMGLSPSPIVPTAWESASSLAQTYLQTVGGITGNMLNGGQSADPVGRKRVDIPKYGQ